MNKIDMKKVVKDRIANQKKVISDKHHETVNKAAADFYKKHRPAKAERFAALALANMENWKSNFEAEFGSAKRMFNMNSAMGYINNSETYAVDLLRSAFNTAANGNDPTSVAEHYWIKSAPYLDEFLKVCADLKAELYQKRKDLNRLESEMLAVITSAKSAKAAAEQLDGLGITFDVPEAKKVQSNLPAVVKLSVDPTLFNKDVAN